MGQPFEALRVLAGSGERMPLRFDETHGFARWFETEGFLLPGIGRKRNACARVQAEGDGLIDRRAGNQRLGDRLVERVAAGVGGFENRGY